MQTVSAPYTDPPNDERIRRMQSRFDALCDRLAQDFSKLPEAQGMAAIEAAASGVRQQMKAEAGIGAVGSAAKARRPRSPGHAKLAVESAKPGKRSR